MGNRVLWLTIDLFGGRCRGHRRTAVANSESARQAAGYGGLAIKIAGLRAGA